LCVGGEVRLAHVRSPSWQNQKGRRKRQQGKEKKDFAVKGQQILLKNHGGGGGEGEN